METRLIKILVLFAFLAHAVIGIDYYKVLEINRDATTQDINRAFRKLSLKYHPDKNPGDQEAAQRFLDINKAHEILSDPEKRRIYDLQGEEGLERKLRGEDDRWGGRRGPNAHADISVTLEDLYRGATRDMSMQRNVICTSCRGTGAKDGQTKICQYCNGQGVRLERVSVGPGFSMQMQTTCQYCGGRGRTFAASCTKCKGRKVVPETKVLHVVIEKGMKDGQQIVFERESEQHPDYTPGDVIFTLRQQPHSRFKRIGNTLFYDCQLDLKEAILGFKKTVKHLDDHYTEISAKPNEVIQPFSVKIIKGEGMPVHNDPGTYGDMHVKFNVKLPKKLSDKDKELIKKIFATSSA